MIDFYGSRFTIGILRRSPKFLSSWASRGSSVVFFLLIFSTLALAESSGPAQRAASSPTPVLELYERGDYERVTQILWKNIERIDRAGKILLAKAHDKRSEPDQVLKAVQLLLSKNAKDAEALTIQARAYLMKLKQVTPLEGRRLKLASLAMDSLKAAIDADPKYVPAYEEVANIYDRKEKPNLYELRLLYQDMIEKIGPKFEFFAKLCKINYLDGVNDPAIESCNKAIQLNDNDPVSFVYLGLVHRQIGNNEKGTKVLKEAAQKFPQSALALETYAKSLEDDKNYIEALQVYETCISVERANENCLVGAGVSASELQKFEKSFSLLKIACSLNRKNAVTVRKIATQLKSPKLIQWRTQFEQLALGCHGP